MKKEKKDFFTVYESDQYLDCWVRLFFDVFSTPEDLEELKKLKGL